MKHLSGLAVLGSLLATSALAASPQDTANFKLDHVVFQGNSRVSTDTLNSIVGVAPGDTINRDKVVEAFNNVIAEYKKDDVGGSIDPVMSFPHPGHMNLTFKITEQAAPAPAKHVPLVMDHETVTGNVKVSSDRLASALTLKTGDTVTTQQLIADRDAIAAVYKGAKMGVAINPNVTYPTPGHVDVNFEITENPPAKK